MFCLGMFENKKRADCCQLLVVSSSSRHVLGFTVYYMAESLEPSFFLRVDLSPYDFMPALKRTVKAGAELNPESFTFLAVVLMRRNIVKKP